VSSEELAAVWRSVPHSQNARTLDRSRMPSKVVWSSTTIPKGCRPCGAPPGLPPLDMLISRRAPSAATPSWTVSTWSSMCHVARVLSASGPRGRPRKRCDGSGPRFPAGDHNARPELQWSPELARQNLTGCATAAVEVRRLWYGERHHAGQFIEEGPDGIEKGVRHEEDTPREKDPDGAKPPAHEYEPE